MFWISAGSSIKQGSLKVVTYITGSAKPLIIILTKRIYKKASELTRILSSECAFSDAWESLKNAVSHKEKIYIANWQAAIEGNERPWQVLWTVEQLGVLGGEWLAHFSWRSTYPSLGYIIQHNLRRVYTFHVKDVLTSPSVDCRPSYRSSSPS